MCLLVLAWQAHPRYRLVVAANRDEHHARPAAALARWAEAPHILAGRDLSAQGTWLGVDRARRFGVVTNFRDLQPPHPTAPSRGALIPSFLAASLSAREYFAALEPQAERYSGFNLLLADGAELWYGSNRATPFARSLAPGVHGLSNELLDVPWPKLRRVRAGFATWLQEATPDPTALFALLADRTRVTQPEQLPHGGLSREWELVLSAPFVLHPQYGTRCSTLLLLEESGQLHLAERRFDAQGAPVGEKRFALAANEWP